MDFRLLAIVLPCLLGLVAALIVSRYLGLWIRAWISGARVSIFSLLRMSLCGVNPTVVVNCLVMAAQAGLPRVKTRDLEAHALAGGNVPRVTQSLIVAHRALIELDWNTAAAIDLAGRDILEAVQTSVYPKVIDCPLAGSGEKLTIDGVSRDGIQLKVRVRVTVRTNLARLIGGATETTVVARVGQGIVSALGNCDSYRTALANPMLIATEVLRKGLDSQTAFAIVSIDIAEIMVGENIGARLQLEQAESDMRMALANAEKRLAMARALDREMRALMQENRSLAALAEAAIPAAIAQAYRDGQFITSPKPGPEEDSRSAAPLILRMA